MNSLPHRIRGIAIILASVSIALLSLPAQATVLWRFGFYWSLSSASYPPSLIPWSEYTHISQLSILPTSECGIDETHYNVTGVRSALVETAHKHNVKALVTLQHDPKLTAIVRCTAPDRIAGFVSLLVNYINENGYDGIDLDWEAGVVPAQYAELVRHLRAAMPDKILTVDIAVHQRSYVAGIQNEIDRINLMNYDLGQTNYHGRPLGITWHNAALRRASDFSVYKSAESNIDYLIASGIDPAKINLGVPFYGYVYQGCTVKNSSDECRAGVWRLHQSLPANGMNRSQIDYNSLMSSPFLKGKMLWDDVSKAPFISYKGLKASCIKYPCDADAFVSYPDPRQMREAVALLAEKRLGGIMTFALHQEYMNNNSGDARYPLTSAIMNALQLYGR